MYVWLGLYVYKNVGYSVVKTGGGDRKEQAQKL